MATRITRRALIPFLGYTEYHRISVEFLREYDSDYAPRTLDIIENTAGYFVFGAVVVAVGKLWPSGFIPLMVFALVMCVLAAAFEADVMKHLKLNVMNWGSFEMIPWEVVRTVGRRVVALGMYHATMFFLVGEALTYLIFPVY